MSSIKVRRIVFINRYFHPDESATSQILADLAFHLAKQKWNVTVIASRQLYNNAKAKLPKAELTSGVRILRIPTTSFGRSNLIGRAMDYVSFYVMSLATLVFVVKKHDIVVAKTDPPLISVVAALVVLLKKGKLINWLQDVFPEVAANLGIRGMHGNIHAALQRLRNWSLSKAHANIVLGERMAGVVRRLGQSESTIITIANWVNDDLIQPIPHAENHLRRSWNLEDKFVVMYSGNYGRVHDFETLFKAANILSKYKRIHFVLIGAGAQQNKMLQLATALNLQNVTWKPYQRMELLPCSLAAGDLHIISLMPKFEGLIVPSKFYGIAASGRPIAFVGDERGEIATLIESAGCGRSFAFGDGQGLADYIQHLANNPDLCVKAGRNSRDALMSHWSRAYALRKWAKLLAYVDVECN